MNQRVEGVFIPPSVHSKLLADPDKLALAEDFLRNFNSWLASARNPFFENYTDHGAGHINAVIASQLQLTTPIAWPLLTAGDALLLLLASSAHDSALHLSEEGFQHLVSGAYPPSAYALPGDRPWALEWELFLAEARRFSSPKLRAVFGEDRPVEIPPRNRLEWSGYDRRLIGEFIRRNHHRMAQEFLTSGIPGVNMSYPLISADLVTRAAEHLLLAGLIARSHGAPLRVFADLMQTEKNKILAKGTNVVFLMSLLRIADYLHISPDRAKPEWLRFKDIANRYSSDEWELNQCVRSATWSEEDPEAIEIIANPSRAALFIRLRALLNQIQGELDATWATLGEVYGLKWHTGQSELGLRGMQVRRLKSPVQDPQKFVELFSPNYVPEEFRFTVDDARLMQLLVGPLYDHDFSAGLRELLQNAVDAVRERRSINDGSSDGKEVGQSPEIKVSLILDEGGDPVTLRVHDSGIGMTEAIIKGFYLRIGSSFGNTEEWSKLFGNPKRGAEVARTGRFGVGMLAAFLLGERLDVRTRHYSQSRGLRFSIHADSDSVDVNYDEECRIGTSVEVFLKDSVRTVVRDWIKNRGKKMPGEFPIEPHYYGESPSVVFEITNGAEAGRGIRIARPFLVPPLNSQPCGVWWYGVDPTFGEFHFAALAANQAEFPMFVNGIGVRHGDTPRQISSRGAVERGAFVFSFSDSGRRFQFNLNRSRVSIPDALEGSVRRVIWEDAIAKLLADPGSWLERRTAFKSDIAYAYTQDAILPISIANMIGGTLAEIAVREERRDQLMLRTMQRSSLAEIIQALRNEMRPDAADFVLLTLRDRLSAGTGTPGELYEGLSTSGAVAVLEDRSSLERPFYECPIETKHVKLIDLELNEYLMLAGRASDHLRLSAFVTDGLPITQSQRDAIHGVMQHRFVSGIAFHRVLPGVAGDTFDFPAVWCDLIGRRGVPLAAQEREPLVDRLPARMQKRVSFWKTRARAY